MGLSGPWRRRADKGDVLIEKLLALLIGELFKKKPWRLWKIKKGMKAWANCGTGSMRRLKLYEQILFVEGWRTQIIGKDIIPSPPPEES